ncbi:MAG: spore maturation protein A [Oscillospiraceae bacterium]|nr:spore maturation protein A [Oscillospiraceae bacterium]
MIIFFGKGRRDLKVILIVLPLISLVFAVINGRVGEMSSSILDRSGEAVTLAISLCGIMCFWCGLMKVAEASGLVENAARLLSPIISLLFGGLKKGGKAAQLIAMNLAANMLGLGNATTPLGINAMHAIAEETGAEGVADDNMIMLTVLNTASLQIIPTTAAALRQANGAKDPMEILPCVWIVSVYAAAVAVAAAKIMGWISRRSGRARGNSPKIK